MSTSRLTQQDMTEAEQRELKTRLDRARIAHGRPLTNSEINHVKKTYIDQLIAERELAAKKARQIKKQKTAKLDTSATYSWSANNHTRGKR
ncbi:DUF3811 domain-containing protein [Buttiauxella warmboldiae]|uniref:DUF3811 domain-containing protein n=1 Tax=Buttiauxella warmboldiae TaxID=82993 RepID=A0A3N5DJ31_9ENTR|nr:DUF3811 domain-containing protein [Buttiauxella warmboldiae]RPH25610.1 DUF3811 domain-containing protein [Buttiauxella warmboldiae]